MPIILASYSGDRNQEDHSLKPVKANTFRPYLKKKEKKNPTQNRAGRVAHMVECLPCKLM
jgi:hypothetical protein